MKILGHNNTNTTFNLEKKVKTKFFSTKNMKFVKKNHMNEKRQKICYVINYRVITSKEQNNK